MSDVGKATAKALKWSSVTEVLAKLVTPVINMLLARILVPEDFGVMTIVTMVISFADIFVESGFQKFLIQHNFDSKEESKRYMSVAFWANLVFALVVWGAIALFRGQIAVLAGGEASEHGRLIAIAGITIPLYGIIGIQNCELKKELEFNKLFIVRMVSAVVPLMVTLPLALFGLGYWSLLIGNIAGVVVRSIMLLFVSKFRPNFYFDFTILGHMLKYGVWTLLDGLAIWATNWIDSLLIARYMDQYYLGLYKNSISTIVSLFTIVTSALTPVLFSSLSKLQDDKEAFNSIFLKIQKTVSTFLLPLSVGIYLYRDFATDILFGEKWSMAADIIGVMAIATALRTIFISLYGNIYHAKGKFFLPLILQLCDLAIIIPTCIISASYGFWPLVYARAFVKLDLIIPEMVLVWFVAGISVKQTAKIVAPSFIATAGMTAVSVLLRYVSDGIFWSIISIIICIIVYFVILFLFKSERTMWLMPIVESVKKRNT